MLWFKTLLRQRTVEGTDNCRDTDASSSIDYTSRATCIIAGPIGRAVQSVVLRPLAYRDCGFESHRTMYVCLVSVMCCQEEVSATS
jgi:hypothetical protein